jgi:hypothetical protein
MSYAALIDEVTLSMTDKDTGKELDAVAVIPGHAPDLMILVNMLSSDQARQLARMADARAEGFTLATAA